MKSMFLMLFVSLILISCGNNPVGVMSDPVEVYIRNGSEYRILKAESDNQFLTMIIGIDRDTVYAENGSDIIVTLYEINPGSTRSSMKKYSVSNYKARDGLLIEK
jgi:regulatory protein YycI of two-component signal transduction system YycFG